MNNDPNVIKIIKGSTRAQVFIHIRNPYLIMLRDVLKRKLADYNQDPRTKVWSVQYRYYDYDKAKCRLLIPINAVNIITDELDALGVPYQEEDEKLVEGRTIKTKMIDSFVPRPAQIPVIEYMSADLPVRKGLSTATGSGKTISAIATIVKRAKCAMVVVSGLTVQWVSQCRAFTNIGERVVLIQGVQSLMKLMEREEKPDIIVFSLETLRRYVLREENYQDLPTYEQFIKYYGIDTKIMDEVHLNFWTGTMIDLHSNIKNNIYLTATFTSSNPQTRRIFNMVYPPDMRYGADQRDKYIRIWSYTYSMYIPEKCYLKQRGYSHNGVEKYLFKRPQKLQHFFETVLFPLIRSHYDSKCKPGQKCLIYFAKIDMIMAAKQWIEKEFPNRKVGVYIGESEAKAYENYEIIVSNLKKSGTGTDIQNLYVTINTVSFKSEPLTIQCVGRLRKLPDGTTPEYIEIVNALIPPQIYHRNDREPIHRSIALEYKQARIP